MNDSTTCQRLISCFFRMEPNLVEQMNRDEKDQLKMHKGLIEIQEKSIEQMKSHSSEQHQVKANRTSEQMGVQSGEVVLRCHDLPAIKTSDNDDPTHHLTDRWISSKEESRHGHFLPEESSEMLSSPQESNHETATIS